MPSPVVDSATASVEFVVARQDLRQFLYHKAEFPPEERPDQDRNNSYTEPADLDLRLTLPMTPKREAVTFALEMPPD